MTQISRGHLLLLALAVATVAVVPLARAQARHDDVAHTMPPPASASAGHPQATMAKMMADMQAKQQHIDQMVAEMNAATGQAKVDQMAAVVTELAHMHNDMAARMTMMMMHGAMAPGTSAPDEQR